MINTSTVLTSSTTVTQTSQTKQSAATNGGFANLLDQTNSLFQLSGKLLDSLLSSRRNDNRSDASGFSSIYPFSSEFEETFGVGGPLPNFINNVTASLKLTAEQNQALQNIAIRNKDITNTPENVQKIAAELRAAGLPG